MSGDANLPLWAAALTAFFVLLGAAVTLTGAIGMLRLRGFYSRVHAPTLGSTAGMACILIASSLYFTVLGSKPVIHEILIAVFVTVTTPITLMLLVRAALYRDRREGRAGVPPQDASAVSARFEHGATDEH
jgi:multicomponent K+:H+ antiporter subunit G